MSHLKVYEKILSDGHESALVMEDDLSLPEDIGGLTEEVARSMDGAEVVMLQYFGFFSAERG